jgi:chemotaxis protein CheD
MKVPPHSDLPQVNLKSGELIVTTQPAWITVVLGSCVAVTMFNPRTRLAAICHAMLPHPRPGAGGDGLDPEPFRYVNQVLPTMADHFLDRSIAPPEVQVKCFGGANILRAKSDQPAEHWVGNANVAAVRAFLENSPFSLAAENVGGTCGCKIFFDTRSGEIFHRHLTPRHGTLE